MEEQFGKSEEEFLQENEVAEGAAESEENLEEQAEEVVSAGRWDAMKDSASRFWRTHFKGEVEDLEKTEVTKTDVAKSLGTAMLGMSASMFGVKVVPDLLRYGAQKYYTSTEKARLMEVFAEHETESPEEVQVRSLEARSAELISGIESSDYLTKAQKQELIGKVQATMETYKGEMSELEEVRNREIAVLIDEAIQTRVKGVAVVKEAVNSALMLTGLSAVRGAAYGSVAMYERYQNVTKEMAEGGRSEDFAKEFFVNGFKETWEKLSFGGEKTKIEKVKGFAEAMGTVGRFVGLGGLAVSEMQSEGVSGAIDTMLEAWEQKSATEFVSDNFVDNFNRVTMGLFKGEASGGEQAMEVAGATEEILGEQIAEPELPAAEVVMGVPEEMEAVRIPEAMLEAATVHKGDGVGDILVRQLEANPTAYGFAGDAGDAGAVSRWASEQSAALLRAEGIVGGAQELRLKTESIDNLAILVVPGEDGLEILYTDPSGAELSPEQVREMTYGFTPSIESSVPVPVEANVEAPADVSVEQVVVPEPSAQELPPVIPEAPVEAASVAESMEAAEDLTETTPEMATAETPPEILPPPEVPAMPEPVEIVPEEAEVPGVVLEESSVLSVEKVVEPEAVVPVEVAAEPTETPETLVIPEDIINPEQPDYAVPGHGEAHFIYLKDGSVSVVDRSEIMQALQDTEKARLHLFTEFAETVGKEQQGVLERDVMSRIVLLEQMKTQGLGNTNEYLFLAQDLVRECNSLNKSGEVSIDPDSSVLHNLFSGTGLRVTEAKNFGGVETLTEAVESALPKEFIPEIREPKVITPDLIIPTDADQEIPFGYHAELSPDGTTRFVQDAPEGYYSQDIPDGIQYVEGVPSGFRAVDTPSGVLYVEKAPDQYKAVPTPEGMKYFLKEEES